MIFTELVVIVSFLSRFQLDRQVTDLNNEILDNQRRIESYGDLEENVRAVQKKIETYNQLKTQTPLTQVLDKLSEITPEDIQFQELAIRQNLLQVSARAGSRQALEQFIQNMQSSQYFYGVVSDNISNTDAKTPGFDFGIQALVETPQAAKKSTPNQKNNPEDTPEAQ